MHLPAPIIEAIVDLDPRDDLSLLFAPEPAPTPEEVEAEAQERDDTLDEAQQAIREAAEAGVLAPEHAEEAIERITAERDGEARVTVYGDDEDGLNFQFDDETGECVVTGLDGLPDWAKRRLTRERLEETCERVGAGIEL